MTKERKAAASVPSACAAQSRKAPEQPTWRHFALIRRIGVGGMGELFLADDLRHTPPRRVVLKRLHPHLTADPAIVEMFTREAQILGSLSHPNIVKFIGTEHERDTFVLVLEWVEGHDLRLLLDRSRAAGAPPAESVAACIGLDVLAALDYAHRHRAKAAGTKRATGVVHRDVSPQNIVVSSTGVAKIIDFGVAKLRGRDQTTRIGALKGKFAYMSPEQFRGEPIDGRADLYSLGVVLYEIATLRRPFVALDGRHLMDAVLAGSFIPPRLARPDISPALTAFLERAINPDRAARFQTPSDMSEALLATVAETNTDPLLSATRIELELRPDVVAWFAEHAPTEAQSTSRLGNDAALSFGPSPFAAVPIGTDGDETQRDATLLGDSIAPILKDDDE